MKPPSASNSVSAILTGAAALCLAACGGEERTRYIDSKGHETVINVDQVNIQDFHIAAERLLQSLYESDAFKNAPRKPPVLAFSQITNDTAEQFDVGLLLQKIKQSVTRSGKAKISAVAGSQSDALAKESKKASEFETGKARSNTPDFTLRGKITQLSANAGNVRQRTYAFHFDVIDNADGTISWSGDEEITKQGTKSSVGW